MSTSRNTDLFSGEIWQVLYSAFSSINFNSTDPSSVNQALQDYVRLAMPEKFNDWIVDSEFVAILDVLSWLAGVVNFRTDIAARENFIDVAESKQSILRLARFLSYNPNRCQPATGILKITDVQTNDDVFDAFGTNLNNSKIIWNDSNNSNWFDQFTSVINNALVNTNPFGTPISDGTLSGLSTQLYRLNGLASSSSLGFSSNVSGTSMDFEICNGDFINNARMFERTPNPNNAFQFYYLNDNQGNASSRTGFFLLFKQGTTNNQVFKITNPVENQLIDIGDTNINQNDVWVNTIDDQANVLYNWTKVPAIFNNNITYNNIPIDQRNIFSVVTRDNDQITLRFSDGRFGNAPSGNIQVSYRVSNGLVYQINPSEINNISLPLTYLNSKGVQKTLTITFSLYESISNASASETVEEIRQRAPQVFGTQGRMVSGEDYNIFPLSSNLAVKIKAVNRVYSGQSRYIDLQDPTGTFQDLSLFSEDGMFFRDIKNTYFEIPTSLNKTASEIIYSYIVPALEQYTTSNLIRDVLIRNTKYALTLSPTTWSPYTLIDVSSLGITWSTSFSTLFQTTGWFSQTQNIIQPGAMIQFNVSGQLVWVAVIDIQGPINNSPTTNTAGPVTLSQEIPTNSIVMAVLPAAYVTLSSTVLSTIQNNIDTKLSFSIWYDYSNSNSINGPIWVVQGPENDFGYPEPYMQGNLIHIMNVDYITGLWRINSRGMQYIFESKSKIQWYDNGKRNLAQLTAESNPDLIKVMRINRNLNDSYGYALSKDYNVSIDRMWSYDEGTMEPRRATVLLYDSNGDGYPDNPDAFYSIISKKKQENFLFWSNTANYPYDEPIYNVKAYDTDTLMFADSPPDGTIGFITVSTTSYLNYQTFWTYSTLTSSWTQDFSNSYRAERGRGSNIASSWVTSTSTLHPQEDDVIFQWKHYAPSDHRIDPASTNIIDIFVLTYAYDTAIRQWITNGSKPLLKPTPPTELDLSVAFSGMEDFKMFSDTIIWRPVKYKFLFGNNADPELTAKFKVVRLPNASVSDGDIKSRIVAAINTFFQVSRWDFGDTFFASELSAFIHLQLAGLISSVVLVPLAADAVFGDNYEISCNTDEIFISTAQVSDIEIISSNTTTKLRIKG